MPASKKSRVAGFILLLSIPPFSRLAGIKEVAYKYRGGSVLVSSSRFILLLSIPPFSRLLGLGILLWIVNIWCYKLDGKEDPPLLALGRFDSISSFEFPINSMSCFPVCFLVQGGGATL